MAKSKSARKPKAKPSKSRGASKSKQPKKITPTSLPSSKDGAVAISVKTTAQPSQAATSDGSESITIVPVMPIEPAAPAQAETAEITPDPIVEAPPHMPDTHKSAVQATNPAPSMPQPMPIRPPKPPLVAKPSPPSPKPESQPQPPAGLSIQINIPTFKPPALIRTKKLWAKLQPYIKRLRPYLTKRRLTASAATVVVLVVALSVVHAITVHHRNQAAARAVSAGRAQQAKPSFKPIVPSNHPDLATPDGRHSRFDSSHGSYSFIDTIKSDAFTVSEQQFASDVAAQSAVGRAAQSLNATHQLTTKWGTAYVVTIQKYSSQELVFSSGNLLCFIQSSNLLSDDQWISYINSLG